MTRLSTTALAALALSLGACGAHYDEADVSDERTLPPDLRTLRVRIPLGSLTVHEGPPGQMRLDGRRRKTAATAEDLERLLAVDFEPRFAPDGEPGVYRYSMPDLPDGVDPRESAMILRAELYLPKDIAVDVETGRGFLSVVGRAADVRLHTGSGDVHLEDVEGDIDVFSGLGGGILHRIRGSVTMETGGGAVLAFIERIGERGIRIKTREPSITVHLPADAGFELDARVIRSTVGKIGVRDSFDVPVVAEGSGHVARGRVGAGGPPVVLETGAGWLSVPTLADDGAR